MVDRTIEKSQDDVVMAMLPDGVEDSLNGAPLSENTRKLLAAKRRVMQEEGLEDREIRKTVSWSIRSVFDCVCGLAI
jgi:hypothetical protein